QGVFGVDTIEEGVLYGDIEEGTARILYQPVTTHPGDHINSVAVGTAMEWMQMTLDGGNGLDPANQVWMWNEIGRLIAVVGAVIAMLAFGTIMLETSIFQSLIQPLPEAKPISGTMRYVAYALTIFVPIITYYWFQNVVATAIIPQATALFPQTITTGIMVWAVGNALITLVLFLIWHFTSNRGEATPANYGLGLSVTNILKAAGLAISIVGFGYVLLAISDLWFKTDFRFWVVAVKLMSSLQFRIFLGYLPFFIFFFLIAGVALHGQMRLVRANGEPVSMGRAMLANVGLLVLGFIVLLLVQYVPLLSGSPLPLGEPLLTIVAFQFVPLLTIAAIWMTWFFRKTGTIYVGAFTAASFIIWVIVAGQATQFAF
ncbi:MAG: alpha/beta hydrolase, partial [Anaerolineae bacterium]|nr:alpha/beta hydrolase [Anaerolineae bacterium]